MSRSAIIKTPLPSVEEIASRANVPPSRVQHLLDLADTITNLRSSEAGASIAKRTSKRAANLAPSKKKKSKSRKRATP
jgi:hypothetical protein